MGVPVSIQYKLRESHVWILGYRFKLEKVMMPRSWLACSSDLYDWGWNAWRYIDELALVGHEVGVFERTCPEVARKDENCIPQDQGHKRTG